MLGRLQFAVAAVFVTIALLAVLSTQGSAATTMQGDADCNQTVNALDALQILRGAASLGAADCVSSANVDCQNGANIVDALLILRYAAGLPATIDPAVCLSIGASPTPTATLGSTPTPGATGTTYYIDSAGGNDANNGTSAASAWKSLTRASAAPLAPGDRLLFRRNGIWTGGLSLSSSGTAASPITIAAYDSGLPPIIQGGSSCVALSASYVAVTSLHLDGCAWAGVQIGSGGTFNRIDGNFITHNVTGVHVGSGASGNRVLNNTIVDNNKMSVNTPCPPDCNDDGGAFGILLNGDQTEVAYNTISGSEAFSYDVGRDGAAVEVYGGQYNNVHHNLAIDNLAFSELGNPRSHDNTFAYNEVRSSLVNSVFLVTRGASSSFGPVLNTRLFNNTVLLTGTGSQGFVCDAGCNSSILVMRNNIIQAVWKAGYADAPFDGDYNLYFGGLRQFTLGAHDLVADPLFVNAASGDLHLQAGSPAIDAGIGVGYTTDFDGGVVPQDGNGDGTVMPDMGAFETAAAQASTPAPTARPTPAPTVGPTPAPAPAPTLNAYSYANSCSDTLADTHSDT